MRVRLIVGGCKCQRKVGSSIVEFLKTYIMPVETLGLYKELELEKLKKINNL